ncbi:GH36-type glycosyl hydrolase domain-containing protein [Thiocapsa sp.]|uniref:GH36-type glycosyl hydrolase domain-containing protein n=1 Tax=Thiocapsa sp. TaxID=2024551 RepID=UPI002C5954A6|nr:glycosyl transferase [Thiocapsa sp.]HSO83189.1 glycosyl transferase [Thiocapsa sp.]
MDTDRYNRPQVAPPLVYRLSNGRYAVSFSEVGSGVSSWHWIGLTRGRADPVIDDLGSVLYLRDLDTGRFWSAGYQPTRVPAQLYRCRAIGEGPDARVELERETEALLTSLTLGVEAGSDLECRRLSLQNRSARARRIEVTSYLEVVVNDPNADAAHPAFSKLFVQTDRDAASGALLARRRPRAAEERWPWLVHAVAGAHAIGWETDRRLFLGRGGSLHTPAALIGTEPLSGALGSVLDPILAQRVVVELAPEGEDEILFLTGAAEGREAALDLIRPFRDGRDARSPARWSPQAPGSATTTVSPCAETDAIDRDGEALRCFNGHGGFSPDGRVYVIRLPWNGTALHRPPQPWINVVANERAGFLVSETGAGYTWSRNSQANRLTPWFNDPVGDPHGEALYLREETEGDSAAVSRVGEVWSPLPGPRPAPVAYEVRHGFGYSAFRSNYKDLVQEVTLFVPRRDPVRILRLRLTHRGTRPRTLSIFSYQQLVLGSQPSAPGAIETAFDPERDILRAVNPAAGDFAGAIVFAATLVTSGRVEPVGFSCNRAAFIGRHRDLVSPAAVLSGADLRGDASCDAVGAGPYPCFAQQSRIHLAPGETAECVFLLGECLDEAELDALLACYRRANAVAEALAEVTGFWTDLTDALRVETPSPAIDLMLNGWLTYQNLACRQWARSAFYQSGGAFGYRDQLQDASALVGLRPDLTRAQILLHAAHQFREGDVLHWWHPAPLERGLRTRFSDDLLWLPFVTADYIRATGDTGILDESVPFLTAPLLAPSEDEVYLRPEDSGESADLYEHCCRAIDRSLTRGAHGLPLMGTGDWNDGMNRVGRLGRGESVWMGFFLYRILEDMLPLCARRGDAARVAAYGAYRDALVPALEDAGWDGAWYRRAYDDEGVPLGSHTNSECRIDALAQAWSVLSGAVDRARAEQAMAAVRSELVDEDLGLIRLLAPPFVDTPQDPGYIKGYVAGVRENGGQYTHAACWAVMAFAELGHNERAAALLERLTPVWHTSSPERLATYGLEPYVVAADIYGAAPHVGRGGWSWYTGSAGWLYRAALESVLGLRVESGRTLLIRPCIPCDWPGFRILYRLPDGATRCDIRVANPHGGAEVVAARLDGQAAALSAGTARILLPASGGFYSIEIEMGRRAADGGDVGA